MDGRIASWCYRGVPVGDIAAYDTAGSALYRCPHRRDGVGLRGTPFQKSIRSGAQGQVIPAKQISI